MSGIEVTSKVLNEPHLPVFLSLEVRSHDDSELGHVTCFGQRNNGKVMLEEASKALHKLLEVG